MYTAVYSCTLLRKRTRRRLLLRALRAGTRAAIAVIPFALREQARLGVVHTAAVQAARVARGVAHVGWGGGRGGGREATALALR